VNALNCPLCAALFVSVASQRLKKFSAFKEPQYPSLSSQIPPLDSALSQHISAHISHPVCPMKGKVIPVHN